MSMYKVRIIFLDLNKKKETTLLTTTYVWSEESSEYSGLGLV